MKRMRALKMPKPPMREMRPSDGWNMRHSPDDDPQRAAYVDQILKRLKRGRRG